MREPPESRHPIKVRILLEERVISDAIADYPTQRLRSDRPTQPGQD